MAKRFTDTDKWKRPWFRQLTYRAKLVWFYVLDNCDHCGVWPVDFELMTFQIGMKVTREEFEGWFAGKFKAIGDDKFFFPSFVTFQQGSLTPSKNAHKPIIAFLEKHGLDLCEQLIPSPSHQDPIAMGPSKGIGKGNGKEGGVGETKSFDLESLYVGYPKKVGKTAGLVALSKQIKTEKDFVEFARAVKKYASDCRRENKDQKYIKQFDTFVGSIEKPTWRDYLEDPKPTPPPALVDVASGGSVGIKDIRPDDPEARKLQADRMRELQATLFGQKGAS